MITEIKDIEEEIDCKINIRFRPDNWGLNNEFWGVQIDNSITPIYCCNCESQLDNFYRLHGGRYGYVGFVNCKCGAQIHCVDSDNIVEYLDTTTSVNGNTISKYYIDFVRLYQLDNISFLKVKEHFNFDIFSYYKNQTVDLKDIIYKLEKDFNCQPIKVNSNSADKFDKLPETVNKWLDILKMIEENTATNSTLPKAGRSWWQKLFGS